MKQTLIDAVVGCIRFADFMLFSVLAFVALIYTVDFIYSLTH